MVMRQLAQNSLPSFLMEIVLLGEAGVREPNNPLQQPKKKLQNTNFLQPHQMWLILQVVHVVVPEFHQGDHKD